MANASSAPRKVATDVHDRSTNRCPNLYNPCVPGRPPSHLFKLGADGVKFTFEK